MRLPSKTDHSESLPIPHKTHSEKSYLKCFVSTQSSLTVPRPAQHQEGKKSILTLRATRMLFYITIETNKIDPLLLLFDVNICHEIV